MLFPQLFNRGIILGGVNQPGNTACALDLEFRRDILARRVNHPTTGEFGRVILIRIGIAKDIVSFRPARKGVIRVERVGNSIHAYRT
jgi:hypothetical protein